MAKEHQVLIIAKNAPGIGTRILALFNRRGFNVTKMTSGITNQPGYARITITVEADDRILDQVQKQIYKLIDVVKVKVFEDHDVVNAYQGKSICFHKITNSTDCRCISW